MDTTSIAALVGLFLGLGAVTSFIMGGLKKVTDAVDGLPPLVKSAVVYVLALIITWVGKALHLSLPSDLTAWNIPVISSVLTAFVAYGWHALADAIRGKTKVDGFTPVANTTRY